MNESEYVIEGEEYNKSASKAAGWQIFNVQGINPDNNMCDNPDNTVDNPENILGSNPDNSWDNNPKGSIVVYYESFEKNILRKLAEAYPQNTWWIEDAISSIVDMYEPFGNFYYYSPEQNGNASLKNVLPVFSSKGYGSLEIQNGQVASLRYLNIVFLKGEKNLILPRSRR